MLRNGGRNGIAANGGLRIMLDRDKTKNKNTKKKEKV